MTPLGNAGRAVIVLAIVMLGLTAPASAVWIADPPMTVDVQVPNNGQLCPGDTVTVVVSDSDTWLDGQAPSHSFATTYTVKVLGPGKNTGNQGSPSSLQFTEPGTYTIIVEADDAGTPVHEGPITKTITVEVKCDCPQGGGDGGDGGGGCGSGNCSGVGGGTMSLASVYLRFAMGRATDGESAGVIWVERSTPSRTLAQPSSLRYDVNRDDVDVIRQSGVLRQVLAPEALADIITLTSYKYKIDFYTVSSVVGMVGGVWVLDRDATPFVTWEVENPDGASAYNRLRVTRKVGTETIRVYNYVGTVGSKNWTLTTSDGTTVGRIESETWTFIDSTTVQRRYEVKEPNQTVVYRVDERFKRFAWGTRKIREAIDPTGANLATEWDYYTNDPNHGGLLKSVVRADGSWGWYTYDSSNRRTSAVESWKDVAFTSNPNPSTARQTTYDYDPVDGNDDGQTRSWEPRVVTESVLGTVVGQTYYAYYLNGSGQLVRIEERCASASSAYGAAGNLRTTTIYLASDATKPESVQYADGRLNTFVYETGGFNGSTTNPQFTTGSGYERTSVTHQSGTPANPVPVAYKSTRVGVVRETATGREVLAETYVYDGSGYTNRVEWTARFYDDVGHLTDVYRSNGMHVQDVWDCCMRTATIDAAGVETSYVPEVLGRVWKATKEGVAASGNYAEQPDIETEFSYNAYGNVLTQTVRGGGLSLASSRIYDLAQRLTSIQDAAQLTTSFEYDAASGGGRQVTVTRPGGATEITEYYCDGRIKCVYGTGVVHRAYRYEVLGSGNLLTTTLTGTSDPEASNWPRWASSRTDLLGRVAEEQRPAYPTGTVSTTYTYDATTGRLSKTTPPDQAPTVHEYDALGNAVRTGLDVDPAPNGDGVLTLSSEDRITDADTVYALDGGAWWRVTTRKVYAVSGSATPNTVGVTREKLTNLGTGVVQCVESSESAGNKTTTTTTVDRTAKLLTQVVDVPDSNIDITSVSRNGLLQSTTSQTGVATTFVYDGLARRTQVVDPRSGAEVTHYDSTGRIDWTENAHGDRITYGYDAAGRISVTGQERNDGGFNYTYQDYTARNELYRVWGDVPQPTEYGYDSTYGERVSLSTFQGGSGWSGATWPSNTGRVDTTTWSYHPATGLLEHKIYADTTAIDYTYTADGRTKTRTWARSSGGTRITTTYAYYGESQGERNTGEMKLITYGDGTPAVTYAYTRSGRLLTVVDDAGTRTFGYDSATLLPTTESFAGGLFPGQVITRQYEALGSAQPSRFSGIQVGGIYAAQYGYAADGRMQRVRGPGLPTSGTEYGAYYTYATNSDLVGLVEIKDAGVAQAETVRQYETTRDLIDYVENRWLAGTPTTVSKYDYTNDTLGRRTRVLRSGNAFSGTHYDDLGYNPRNELESSDCFTGSPPGTPQPAQDFAYLYDNIGNRTSYTPGTQSPPTTYAANALNQYTATQNPAESFTHDLDGNLTQDGSFAYIWDAENRLVEATPLNPTTGAQKVVNRYDYLGRRVQKQVWTWNGANWGASPTAERRFVYDGRLLLLELDGLDGNAALRKYTWGLDLSGLNSSLNDRRAAGGIGGLLATEDVDPGTQQTGSFLYFYDANGNVGQVLGTATGSVAVKYEYDPYGNRTNTPTRGEFDQPFRFSTKYFDAESGLYDFGVRFYSPRTGRWTSRDGNGESGTPGLYVAVRNDPYGWIDPDGGEERQPGGPSTQPQGTPATQPGPKVIQGIPITTDYCGCQSELKREKDWATKLQDMYRKCGEAVDEKGNKMCKDCRDIEKCIKDALAAEGIETTTAGSTKEDGSIDVKPQTGKCGPLLQKGTELHENVHRDSTLELLRQYGKYNPKTGKYEPTPEYRRERCDADRWWQDEVKAYGAEKPFYDDVTAELDRICGTTSKPSGGGAR